MKSSNSSTDIVLRMEHVTKRFPQVLANDDISFDIGRGEIHCLLGENGAGKSTLAESLYGTYTPDSGTIYFNGEPVTITSPKDAIEVGIGMVHQHFVLVPPLSVIENVVLGTQKSGLLIDVRRARGRLEDLCSAYDVDLDLHARIWHLSVGEQQWVEILKALYVGVDLLILDEPTAVLTPQATERLFAILQKMKEGGLSILFITHKLDEVMEVSDRVTVLRRGKLVDTVNTSDVTKEELARMMVGRDVIFRIQKETVKPGEPILQAENLHALDDRGAEALRGVSFDVREYEILGLAGVSGNGQSELFELLVGVREATEGTVLLRGENVTNQSPRAIMGKGVASVPEDRIKQGLVMDFRVEENLILGIHRHEPFSRGSILLDQAQISGFARKMIDSFDIATPSSTQVTRVLSGGNLQKVILAREFSIKPDFLIANQPTRGLDVGATEYVRSQLLEQRKSGAGILLISDDLDEILNLADRLAVIFKGSIMGILDAETAEIEELGLLMAGTQGSAS